MAKEVDEYKRKWCTHTERRCQELVTCSCKIQSSSPLNLSQEEICAYEFIMVLRREMSVGDIQLL
jgi:hypothetical protein